MHSACACGKFVLRYLKLFPYKVYRYLLSWSVLATGFFPVFILLTIYQRLLAHMKHVEGSLILLRGITYLGRSSTKAAPLLDESSYICDQIWETHLVAI